MFEELKQKKSESCQSKGAKRRQRADKEKGRSQQNCDVCSLHVERIPREGERVREEPRGQRKEATGLPTAEGRGQGGEKPGLNGNGGLVVMEKEAGGSGSTLSIREGGDYGSWVCLCTQPV